MAIISTNSQTKAELAVIPSCSGVNLKKEKKQKKQKQKQKQNRCYYHVFTGTIRYSV